MLQTLVDAGGDGGEVMEQHHYAHWWDINFNTNFNKRPTNHAYELIGTCMMVNVQYSICENKKMHMSDRRMGWIMLGWINLCLVRAS